MNRYTASGKVPARHKRTARHYWLYWAGVLCALAAVVSAFGVMKERGHQRSANASVSIAKGEPTSDLELDQRRIYPYSVIPGGVESAQELRNAIAHDAQVAQLYAHFDFSRAHIERLAGDRELYVAYRYDDRIYWTQKRVLLRSGETVITDGKETGRTRCGNRVSVTPMQPVRQDEPLNAAANTPVAGNDGRLVSALPLESPYLDPRMNALLLAPQASPPTSLNPPPFFPLVAGGPSSYPNVTPPPPVETPEPGTLPLLALGFIALGLIAILRIRKPRNG